MSSLKQHAGYLVVDHRDSPGLSPADVAHVPGAEAVGKGEMFEADVLTCSHCQRGIVLNPARVRERGYCGKCDHYVCDQCETIRVKTGECMPIAKVVDQARNAQELFVGREDHPDASPSIRLTDSF